MAAKKASTRAGLIAQIPRLARAEREMIEGGNAARLLKIRRRK